MSGIIDSMSRGIISAKEAQAAAAVLENRRKSIGTPEERHRGNTSTANIRHITRARHGLNSLSVLTLRSKSARIRPPAMWSQDPEGYAVPSARSVG